MPAGRFEERERIVTDSPDGADALRERVQACVLGKAYIAVLKHQLTGKGSKRTFREVFDQAYREASALAKCEPLESLGISRFGRPPP